MQFSILSVLTLAVAAMAMSDGKIVKRQQAVDVGAAAMTDADGNVLPFDSKKVYLPSSKDARRAVKF